MIDLWKMVVFHRNFHEFLLDSRVYLMFWTNVPARIWLHCWRFRSSRVGELNMWPTSQLWRCLNFLVVFHWFCWESLLATTSVWEDHYFDWLLPLDEYIYQTDMTSHLWTCKALTAPCTLFSSLEISRVVGGWLLLSNHHDRTGASTATSKN